MTTLNVNCSKKDGKHCKDKRIARSFFGLGKRLCIENVFNKCSFKERPAPPQYKNLGQNPGCEKLRIKVYK